MALHGVAVAVALGNTVGVAAQLHCVAALQLDSIAAAQAALIGHGQAPLRKHATSSPHTVLLGLLSQFSTMPLPPHRHDPQLSVATAQKSAPLSHETGTGVGVIVGVDVIVGVGTSAKIQLVLPPPSTE